MDKKYKIILIGDPQVGKTSLIRQFTQKIFSEDYTVTTNNDKSVSEYEDKNGTKYKFDIWDTVGQENSTHMNKTFLKNANGIMAVYDITNQKSFDDLSDRIQSALFQNNTKTPMIIVGNKSDLYEERIVDKEEGENFAKKYNGAFYETSATTYDQTFPAFKKLFDIVIEDVKKKEETNKNMEETVPISTIENTVDGDNNHNTYKCCWCC